MNLTHFDANLEEANAMVNVPRLQHYVYIITFVVPTGAR